MINVLKALTETVLEPLRLIAVALATDATIRRRIWIGMCCILSTGNDHISIFR